MAAALVTPMTGCAGKQATPSETNPEQVTQPDTPKDDKQPAADEDSGGDVGAETGETGEDDGIAEDGGGEWGNEGGTRG